MSLVEDALRSKAASFAQEIHQNLSKQLNQQNEHLDKIIDNFGGIDTMLYLCLSNLNCCDYITQEQFNALKQLVTVTEDRNAYDKCAIVAVPTPTTPQPNKIKVASTNDNRDAFFTNLTQFHKHSMIFVVDPYENFYIKVFNLSFEKVQFIIDKVLFTKWFPFSVAALISLTYLISQIHWHNAGYQSDWLHSALFAVRVMYNYFFDINSIFFCIKCSNLFINHSNI